jgi:hypothetical protein
MGHLKLAPPFNVVVSPRVLQTSRRPAPRAPRNSEDDALTEIAQRFAPGASLMADPAPAPSPNGARVNGASVNGAGVNGAGDGGARGAAGAFKALPQSFQGLILALILIALLPSLTLTALVWFGPAEITGFVADKSAPGKKTHQMKTHQMTAPRIKTASLVDVSLGASEPAPAAAPDTIAAADTGETGEASLATPHRLEAEAGLSVPFTIALASVEPLPSRSVIAVTGLPAGATLSAGRPYTEREWNVRPDELSGLRLYVPETAQGETVLEIALIASDGETLAEAQTALKVTAPVHVNTAAPAPAPVPGFDPYAGPSIGEVAALQISVPEAPEASEGLAPEPQAVEASEPQASEPDEAETAATEDEPDAGAAEAAADEAASSEAASGDAASSEAASSEPASGSVPGEPVAGEPVSEPTSPESGPFADSGAKPEPSLALSDFVNLRARPTSSARVIAVIAKGTKVTPKAKRRGWLKVTDAESGKTGWIYGRYAGGTAQASNASPSRLSAGATADEESVLTKFGRWLVY